MKLIRTFLVVVMLLAGATVLLPAPTVWACDCAVLSAQEYFTAADAVFTGTVTARFEPTSGPRGGSSDPIVWNFAVESTAKGTVSHPQDVISAASEVSCGYEFAVGQRYQVYARRAGGELETGLCSGTRLADAVSPTAGETTPATAVPIGLPRAGVAAAQPEPGMMAMSTAALLVAALLLLVTVSIVAVRRRRAPA